MEIDLMRHGQTDWNKQGRFQGREDLPLNETGREDARQAGLLLRTLPLDALIVSPLRRAVETAQWLNRPRQQKLPILVEPQLIERDYGRLSGLLPEQRAALGDDWTALGVETPEQVLARVLPVLERWRTRPGRRVLLVTHGGVINQVLIWASRGAVQLGGPRLKNLCVSRLLDGPDGLRLGAYNLTPEEWVEGSDPL